MSFLIWVTDQKCDEVSQFRGPHFFIFNFGTVFFIWHRNGTETEVEFFFSFHHRKKQCSFKKDESGKKRKRNSSVHGHAPPNEWSGKKRSWECVYEQGKKWRILSAKLSTVPFKAIRTPSCLYFFASAFFKMKVNFLLPLRSALFFQMNAVVFCLKNFLEGISFKVKETHQNLNDLCCLKTMLFLGLLVSIKSGQFSVLVLTPVRVALSSMFSSLKKTHSITASN